jgi:hypothetical protein
MFQKESELAALTAAEVETRSPSASESGSGPGSAAMLQPRTAQLMAVKRTTRREVIRMNWTPCFVGVERFERREGIRVTD